MNLRVIILLTFLLSTFLASAQHSHSHSHYSRQDSLRGSITPERQWWDLSHYKLEVKVNLKDSTISGQNTIKYQVLQASQRMQIDLQEPMKITKVLQDNKNVPYSRDGNVYYLDLIKKQNVKADNEVVVFFEGKPRVSTNPPWSGGFSWDKDDNQKPFISTTCQGIGASLWWPCKDHMYDEPDGMVISVTAPKGLMNVSNGQLTNTKKNRDGSQTFEWTVVNPINNYGVNINIGDYVHFNEIYQGERGGLTCNYYVLRDNLNKAKEQFKQVPMMLEAFEHWFGPYPFYEDTYKLVEVPYLGMEHQSSVTYGNEYINGYLGRDLSASGWGFKFDFIIIHESGHEWFANSITNIDVADMWIHEGFTAYSESLYLNYHFGKKASNEYVIGTRRLIQNDRPIIGTYNVNMEGSGDMYYKGANILHMVRQLIQDDEKWRAILRGINQEYFHKTVSTAQIETYLSWEVGIDLTGFFDQYLRDTKIPVLEYVVKNNSIRFRWNNIVEGFEMPVRVFLNGEEEWITPRALWSEIPTQQKVRSFKVDPNFYIATFDLLGGLVGED